MGDSEKAVISIRPAMSEFSAEAWDACAGPENPFLRHAFLEALESSGSARRETGWQPYHLALEDESGTLLGAVPMYIKSHSQGEYVFDHQWAAAYERAGGQYYPKLLVAVPFTPVTGARLLARPGPLAETVRMHLLEGCTTITRQLGVSSVNINFLTEAEWTLAGKRGWLQRMDQQFHWENRGYDSFDDFLADLSSRKRKTLKRERRDALSDGITIDVVTGKDITEDHWDSFWQFYQDTGSRKWAAPISPAVSSRCSASAWPTPSSSSSPGGPANMSPAPSISKAPTRSTAATGGASRTIPFCISKSAITRRSTTPSRPA